MSEQRAIYSIASVPRETYDHEVELYQNALRRIAELENELESQKSALLRLNREEAVFESDVRRMAQAVLACEWQASAWSYQACPCCQRLRGIKAEHNPYCVLGQVADEARRIISD